MLKLSLGSLGRSEDCAISTDVKVAAKAMMEGKLSEEEGRGAEPNTGKDEDHHSGKLQAPAARKEPIYNKRMFAQFNPYLDKECGEKPFPRKQQVPEPPGYVAGNVRLSSDPVTRRSVSLLSFLGSVLHLSLF